MFRMKRLAVLLITALALSLLAVGEAVAGGGNFPAFPPDLGFALFDTSDGITAVIVLDPNGPDPTSGLPSTPTGTFGTITVTRPRQGDTAAATAAAAFQVQPESSLGGLRFGCNLLLTNSRFVEFAPGVPGVPLGGGAIPGFFENWLPSDVTTKLLNQLFSPGTPPGFPGISSVISQKCVPFPKKRHTLDFMPFNEILEHRHIRPLPPTYPDRTIIDPLTGLPVTDPMSQWFPGFLVLKVNIGLWE